jgi:hypothetical protein
MIDDIDGSHPRRMPCIPDDAREKLMSNDKTPFIVRSKLDRISKLNSHQKASELQASASQANIDAYKQIPPLSSSKQNYLKSRSVARFE